MARLQAINQDAISLLGDILTFTSYKGVPIVKKRPAPYSFKRSPRVQVMMRRMRIAGSLTRLMDKSVRDAYKRWTRGTSFMWKDVAVREILSIWNETNQCPVTFRHFSYEVVEGVLTLNFIFNPIFADTDAGYGMTGWGISPWGTPPEFLTDEGFYTGVSYDLASGDPIPWPDTGFGY